MLFLYLGIKTINKPLNEVLFGLDIPHSVVHDSINTAYIFVSLSSELLKRRSLTVAYYLYSFYSFP